MHMFKRNTKLDFLQLLLSEIFKLYVKNYHTFFHEMIFFLNFPIASRNFSLWFNFDAILTNVAR